MQAITRALRAHGLPAAVLLVLAVAHGAVCAGPAAASTYSAADAHPRPIPWTGWDGVPIQHPHKAVARALLDRASFPKGWSAGAIGFGSGYRRLNGSKRVREVQRRLTRLGYHTGPIDGLLGPLTRSSIQWFQIKHGLRPTGVVAASTLAFLRHPKDRTGELAGLGKKAQARSAPKPEPAPKPTGTPAAAKPAGGGAPDWLVPLLIVLGLALVAVAVGYVLSRRKAPAAWATATPEADPPVIGYVASEDTEEAESQAAIIGEACDRRGWILEQVFLDWDMRAPSLRRPGLSQAFDQLRTRRASRLVVVELQQLAGSREELQLVLAAFREEQVVLTALDVDFDTEVEEIVARHIRRLRGYGMTFQAVADVLNAQEVPAPGDEDRWRPSTVRSVLGKSRFYGRSRTRAEPR